MGNSLYWKWENFLALIKIPENIREVSDNFDDIEVKIFLMKNNR